MQRGIFPDKRDVSRRIALIGGFLGAGKTTLIGYLSEWLRGQELRVGLVTNDQGKGLMDTASARGSVGGGQVKEITGGCFCCRLDELVEAVGQLDAGVRPDVIVAEPVGSCTDLLATVILPLEQVYRVPFSLAPLSVVLDARRALASLGGRRSARDFHRDVGYVFRKQIEEAEWLVVNKIDLMGEQDLADLHERLRKQYPGKKVFSVSARTGEGLESWFEAMMGASSAPSTLMEVDYDRYATGEALLGWVNSEAECRMLGGGNGWGGWLHQCGRRIASLLDEEGGEIGHFKMSVEAGGRRWRFHQVMMGEEPVLIEEGGEPAASDSGESRSVARLLVNLRAEGEAGRLEDIVRRAFVEQDSVEVTVLERAAFQPGEPRPTHRVTALAEG
jgi:G3E family GTPase